MLDSFLKYTYRTLNAEHRNFADAGMAMDIKARLGARPRIPFSDGESPDDGTFRQMFNGSSKPHSPSFLPFLLRCARRLEFIK